jgi:PAS domain S-box-containing protein
MEERPEYDELLKRYRELQLRVTRFSSVEQELINTRDRLDHELVLHQRLHRYNSDALKEADDSAFFQLEAEAIVDVFEMESSLVVYHSKLTGELLVFREGSTHHVQNGILLEELRRLRTKLQAAKTKILTADLLNISPFLSNFEHGLWGYFKEETLGYEIYLLGLTSKINAPLYARSQDRHLTIFGVYQQQFQAMLANRKRSEEISNQMEQIKVSQRELRKLSLIATRTKNGVIISDKYGCIEWVNDAFCAISGYTLEEVLGKKPKDLLQGPKTDLQSREILKKALWNKENVEVTLVNYDREGREYYNQLEIVSVFDEQGNHTNFIALQKDITSETLTRQEMQRMNTRFELIAKQSRIGTWEFSPEDGNIRWSEMMYNIYGVEPSTPLPITDIWRNAVSLEDYNQAVADMNRIRNGQALTSESTFHITRQSDGSERVLQTLMVAERDEQSRLIRVVGSSKDITEELTLRRERDAAAERMLTLKTFYESILNHSPSQKYVFDAEGRLLFSSEPSKEGAVWWDPTSRQSIFDSSISGLNSRTDKLVSAIKLAMQQRHIIRVEDDGYLNDGRKVGFLQSILPYEDFTGKLEHIIVTGVDITELKTVEEALSRKNEELRKTNAELDNFVYSISHDLRSPLLSIKGIVSLITQSSEIDDKNRRYLEMVDGSVSRLDGTIQEILEYSRNSRLEIEHESFDVVKMIQEAFNDLRYSAEGQLELLLDIQTVPVIHSDRSRVGVLLKNIIGNSIKYRRKDIASFVKVTLTRQNHQVFISIADNGEGIEQQHLDQVFTMFFRGTTSSVGTGLGLYICKEIVNKLQGELKVTSTKGEGTTMLIILPEQ